MIADIVAQDAQGRDVLVVRVKGLHLDSEIVGEVFREMELEAASIPYGMIVDPDSIYVVEHGIAGSRGGISQRATAEILKHYDAEYGEKRVSQGYLKALVNSWLRDLAYHWKSSQPPQSEWLAEFGLLTKLEGGSTQREVPLGADAVR